MTEEQLLDSIVVRPDGCWTTTYTAKTPNGYSLGKLDGRVSLIHRYLYTRFVGDPGRLDVHHRCENRECLNWGHMETVTRRDHMALHGNPRQARKSRCFRGHRYVERDGRQVCLECRRIQRALRADNR